MQNKTKFLGACLASLLILCMLPLTVKGATYSISVTGTVTKSGTSNPVQSVAVKLEGYELGSWVTVMTDYTDGNGDYHVEAPLILMMDNFRVTWSKTAYTSQTKTYGTGTITHDVSLVYVGGESYDVSWTTPANGATITMDKSTGPATFDFTYTKEADLTDVKLFFNSVDLGSVFGLTTIDVDYNAAYDGAMTAYLRGYDGSSEVSSDSISLTLDWVGGESYDVSWSTPVNGDTLTMGPSNDPVAFDFTYTKEADLTDVKLFFNSVDLGSVFGLTTIDVDYNAAYDGAMTAYLRGYDGSSEVSSDSISLTLIWVKYFDFETLETGIEVMPNQLYSILHDPLGDHSFSHYEEDHTYKLGFGAEITVGGSYEMTIGAEFDFFGIAVGASQAVEYSAEVSVGYDFEYEVSTTMGFTSNKLSDESNDIGPGYGDAYWGEGWSYNWSITGDRITYHNGTIKYSDLHMSYGIVRKAELLLTDMSPELPLEWRNLNPVHNGYQDVTFDDAYVIAGGLEKTYEKETSTTNSISAALEIGVSSTTQTKLGLAETKIELSTSMQIHSSAEFGDKIKTGYEIFDDDSSDILSFEVGTDPVFGTPIFRNIGSQTSGPLEHGTTDYEAPIIGEPTINYDSDGLTPNPSGSDQPLVTVLISDEGGVANAYLWYSTDNVSFDRIDLIELGGSTGTYEASIPTHEHNTLVYWYIEAFDTAANAANKNNSYGERFTYLVQNRDPEITLSSPNGSYTYAEEITISWTASDPDGDDLTYILGYSNDGSIWHQIASSLTDLSYIWDISSFSDTPAMLVKVTAEDGYGGSAVDESDYGFAIDNPDVPHISIEYPETGLEYSGNITLSWTIDDIDEALTEVAIYYSADGGTIWSEIVSGLAPSTTSYDWNTVLIVYSEMARIRINGSYILESIPGISTTTSGLFTVNNLPSMEVSLVSPNGGEIFGTEVPISWTISSAPETIWTADLAYTTDGNLFTTIAEGITDATYLWNTQDMAPGTNYRVKVSITATYFGFEMPVANDISEVAFEITDLIAPVITIISPLNNSVFLASDIIGYEYSVSDLHDYSVEIFLNNLLIVDIGSLGTLPAGTYVFKIVATDEFDNTSEKQVSFRVLPGSNTDDPPVIPGFPIFSVFFALSIGILLVGLRKFKR